MELFDQFFWILLLEVIFSTHFIAGGVLSNYLEQRNELIEQENRYAFGGTFNLTEQEIPANECLMYYKRKEVDGAFKNPTKFLPSHNFLEVQNQIEASPVFKIIQMAPKGGVLHAHSTAIASASYIVKHMTYEPNLYICLDSKPMKFYFFKTPSKGCNWVLLSELRKKEKSIDSKIHHALVLSFTPNSNGNEEWHKFENIFTSIKGLISYRPIFEKHLIRAMDECTLDNVMFMEIRSSLTGIYDLEGTQYDQLIVAKLYANISKEYVEIHPNFLGLKIIYASYRGWSKEGLDKDIQSYRKLRAAMPDFIIGFDLIGNEDKLPTLLSRLDQLIPLAKENTAFFFHAGETNWYGHSTDQNLYDAVLLNTKRIGHGFALTKHPKLMELIKQRKIAIEVNPISNQVLSLVNDMRNHPASIFFAENMPVVISNDDPAFWSTQGLSDDFYEAFIGMMSRDADLRALKQLALNSIEYSSLTKSEIVKANKIFYNEWKKFIQDLLKSDLCTKKS